MPVTAQSATTARQRPKVKSQGKGSQMINTSIIELKPTNVVYGTHHLRIQIYWLGLAS